jgi:hypothetical protein
LKKTVLDYEILAYGHIKIMMKILQDVDYGILRWQEGLPISGVISCLMKKDIDYNLLNTLGSKPYRNKDQIKTYSLFFENRFLKEFESKRDENKLILYTPDYKIL